MFESFKRARRDDSVFGSMLYMGDELEFWEGKIRFAPTGHRVQLTRQRLNASPQFNDLSIDRLLGQLLRRIAMGLGSET